MWIAGALLILLNISSWAQVPTYTCDLRNLTQVSCNVFEFDVFIRRTGSFVFKLAQFQIGIIMNSALVNGGTITITPVANSSTLTNLAQVPGPEKFSFDAAKSCIAVTPVAPPGAATASIISNTGFGTRYIRIRVMNSVPWPAQPPNLVWNFSLANGYWTKMFAYVGSINTDITVQASHTTNNMANNGTNFDPGIAPPVVQTVTGRTEVLIATSLELQGHLLVWLLHKTGSLTNCIKIQPLFPALSFMEELMELVVLVQIYPSATGRQVSTRLRLMFAVQDFSRHPLPFFHR